ncbi:MAG: DUF5009 domain-containing protein [Tannerellaceae bacterium]|nr:DUF5009 domain-containing protein [Tannerellaceae bacterium]
MQNNRLLALDVMRGITIAGMILVNNPGSWSHVYAPLQHAVWNGLTPTDLVYPFFMFMMGVSLHFSLRKYENGEKGKAIGKIIRRTLAIFMVGLALELFSKVMYGQLNWETFRVLGVMQRLALAYGGGALLALLLPKKYYLGVSGGILLFYMAILHLFNGYVHSGENLISVVDQLLLGAGHLITERLPDGTSFPFEPEGLLSTLPCFAHVLIGGFAGCIISQVKDNGERTRGLFILGTILLFAGYLVQYGDPINKKLWTSSYTLVTCGAGSLLLALLVWIIDMKHYTRWSRFFEAFGINPLFMYVAGWVLGILAGIWIKPWLYGKVLVPVAGYYLGSLLYALLFTGLIWVVGYGLYIKRIYIKL